MEELEDPTESLHEHIHEEAHHAEATGNKWIVYVALTTAVIAVLSAITSLLAAYHADESMLSQIKASDQWAYYQAKGIKTEILVSDGKLLKAIGKAAVPSDEEKISENKAEQQEIMNKAKEYEAESHRHAESHNTLARSVTLFQIAIAIGAISILIKKRIYWLISLAFAGVAAFFFILQLIGR
ncbi:DUF4337 domain-containing protein [Mucilaginibacter paludis]|uniref:DUF4337 domain-containing protein n=1 Tax=Mucilaginibacter paludis DSM 18603 TaxID=714943 RepID=H1YDI6_9SPHI|nr:DUF4337 domain-containing protein [Mucilaginibacter paludis]EHQ30195.1 hypothetical protein Mucpa_6137 [Mucilaginibacter paludis DSM 18603]